jgi:hypothetical protein
MRISSKIEESLLGLDKPIIKWAPAVGLWDTSTADPVYLKPQENNQPYGLCISDVRFQGGMVKVTVCLPKADDGDSVHPDTAGGILIGYRSPNDEYLSATLGGYGRGYTLTRFTPDPGWVGIAAAGSRENLIPERPYVLSVRMQGLTVTVEVDGVPVLAHKLETPPPQGQLGLYTWGPSRVEFKAACVTDEPVEIVLDPVRLHGTGALGADLPDMPPQGVGPHFEIDERGVIGFAPPEALDRQGNHVQRLRSLHPTLCDLSGRVAAALGAGNSPHSNLRDRAIAYRERVDQPLEQVDFTLLYVEGVRLANADHAAAGKIIEGELPSLDAPVREALDSLLQLNGTFLMATVEGIETIAAEERYRRRPDEEREYRAAAVDFAASLQNQPDVIDSSAASLVLGAAEQIGQGANPERSGVVGTGAVRNVTITLAAGAAIVALPVVGGFALGTGGVIAGTLGLLVFGEGLKKSKSFADVTSLVTRGVDAASRADFNERLRALAALFRSHLDLVREIEPKMRRIARHGEEFSWINKLLDWLTQHPPYIDVSVEETAHARDKPLLPRGTWVRLRASARPLSTLTDRICAVSRDDSNGSVEIVTHMGSARCRRDEIAVLRDQSPRPAPMRYRLPYGKWICADGREVLFNREYRAIWQRYPGDAIARRADIEEWVKYREQQWFFGDHNPPWRNRETERRCEEILRAFGGTSEPPVDGNGFASAVVNQLDPP